MPEITHMLMWAMSDRAIPRSYRTMQGFGVHTYRLVNAAGESHFVKFHWSPKAGTHSLVVVEHDMAFIEKIARKVTVLHEGAVIAEGAMEQVRNDPRVIEVYLGR